MPFRVAAFFLLLMGFVSKSSGQACTTLGQNPSTAFPVCGTNVFSQTIVPNCGGRDIPAKGCADANYQDLNPFWYKFTCYQTGTLGFVITPVDQGDDYDWQIFDITNHDPNEVYTNSSLFVAENWSGRFGNTGTSSSGNSLINCAGDAFPTFSSMPTLIQGHNYILLISHFNTFKPGQAGYSLSFNGGTAVITDTTKPAMQTATVKCDAKTIYLKLNKSVKCNSLTGAGNEFSISPKEANVISASGTNCNASFDMDSIIINFDKEIKPGYYYLKTKNGSDNNSLLDNCDNAIPEDDSIPFTITPLQPTSFDSIVPVGCAPDTLQFYFKKAIRCSSVASDGSDFSITGTAPVSIIKAYGASCDDNGVSPVVNVVLNHPILTNGSYTVTLKNGTDLNTIIDECAQETPVSESISFITADTVSAAFSYRVGLGCVYDTLLYAHDGKDHTNEWDWTFDSDGVSTARDSIFLFNDYGKKHIQLFASNGVCADTASADILLDNELKARFAIAPSTTLCPEDVAVYTDSSTGKLISWYWVFGDGLTSTLQNPPPKKYAAVSEHDGRFYPVALIVQNDIHCFDTAQLKIKVLYNCYIAVPTAFTPNGDGLNDFLYPLDAYKADNLEFKVFNRYGQMVFATKNWMQKWDGRINGTPQGSGTYVWFLSYTEHDTGKKIFLKGTSVLIR